MHICCYGEEARLPESLARCQAHPTPVTAGLAARGPGPGGAWARTPSTFHAWSSGPLCPSVSLCLALISPSLSPTPLPPSFSSLGLRLPGCLAAWLSLIARPPGFCLVSSLPPLLTCGLSGAPSCSLCPLSVSPPWGAPLPAPSPSPCPLSANRRELQSTGLGTPPHLVARALGPRRG